MNIDYDKLKDLLLELSKCGTTSYSASDEYNIFEVLGVEYKEVIVCRFIGDLLDPKGKHGLGSEPLRLFIRDVLHDKNFGDNLDESNIVLEDSTDNGRRVDIAIYLKDRIYPIEVKIWAGDQNKQLKDYYEYYFPGRTDAKIYYLTPNGHTPSDESTGEGGDKLTDKQIVRISFTEEIKKWLDKVLNIESASESIKSVIRNFMEVIDKMAEESNVLKEITAMLGLNSETRELDSEGLNSETIKLDSDEIKGTIRLLKYRDEIWDTIRRNYIRKILDCGDTFELTPADPNDNNAPQYTLFCVKKNGKDVAWICVEEKLYLVTDKNPDKDTCNDGWTQSKSDINRQWKYITNDKSKRIQLNVPTELDCNLRINLLAELPKSVVD